MVVDATLIAAGAAGIIVGWLVYYFLIRFPAHDPATLVKLLAVIFTGAGVTFVANTMAANKDAFNAYIVGVLIGMVVYFILKRFNVGPTVANPS